MQPQRLTQTALICLSLMLLAACATNNLEQDYQPDTVFNPDWQRYDWRGGQVQVPGASQQQLRQIAERALAEQGYEKDEDAPELLLSLSAVTRASTGANRSVGLSVGLPIGTRGAVGLGGSRSLDNDKMEGVLILDITRAEDNELIWRGSAAGIAIRDFELARQAQLQQTFHKLLAQFPPE